jgi:hypothetical protein
MAKKQVAHVVAEGGIPYLLTATKLVEGSCAEYENGNVVPYTNPNTMSRTAVKKAMRGPVDFRFQYKRTEDTNPTDADGHRNTVSILFGCTRFGGNDYKKLRKWALAGTKK